MSDSFDPYCEWLDLPTSPRPVDHYTLLRIERFESDSEVIAQAADSQQAKIRKVRPGTHLRDWGRVLDQIAAVKVCLLDPKSKAVYDASLPGAPAPTGSPKPTQSVSASAPAAADPMAPPSGAPSEPSPDERPKSTERAPKPVVQGSGHSRRWVVVGAIFLVLTLAVGPWVVVICRPRKPQPPPAQAVAAPPKDPAPSASSPAPAPTAPTPRPAEATPAPTPIELAPEPVEPVARPIEPPSRPARPTEPPSPDPPVRPPAERPPSPPRAEEPSDPQRRSAFARAVADARHAMSQRDVPAAERHLQTAGQKAQNEADRSEHARLKTMLHNLREFWSGIREGVAGLDVAGELEVKNTRVAIVEADRRHLLYRYAGKNLEFTIEALPTPIVLAVADGWFHKNHPSTKVLLGTFLAVDPNGDRARARKLWQQATREGIDMGSLMPELEMP